IVQPYSHTDSSNGGIDGRIYLEIDVNDVEHSRTSKERPFVQTMSAGVIKLVAAVKPKQDEWPMCGQWRGQETSVLLLTVRDILFRGQNARILLENSSVAFHCSLPGHPGRQRDVACTVVTIANLYTSCGCPWLYAIHDNDADCINACPKLTRI
ncbi:unnamed protein product, partial [Heterotrigona itama]